MLDVWMQESTEDGPYHAIAYVPGVSSDKTVSQDNMEGSH